MNLSIPYDFLGVDHKYEPDFLVRIASPASDHQLTLVLEVKGFQGNREAAKHDGARRWVRAVNNWGKLGHWAFHVCRNPQTLERELAYVVREWCNGSSDSEQGALEQTVIEDMQNHSAGDAAIHGPKTFHELDEVALARPVYVKDAGRELPAGARGTVLGVWQGGRAYEVEFATPFECLVTVPAEGLAV